MLQRDLHLTPQCSFARLVNNGFMNKKVELNFEERHDTPVEGEKKNQEQRETKH